MYMFKHNKSTNPIGIDLFDHTRKHAHHLQSRQREMYTLIIDCNVHINAAVMLN